MTRSGPAARTLAVACAATLFLAACSHKKPSASSTPSQSPTPFLSQSPSPSPSKRPSSKPSPKPSAKPTQPAPAGFNLASVRIKLTTFRSGLSRPVFITSAPGSNLLYIVEQTGVILAVDSTGHTRGTFLSIGNIVNSSGNEQGLLGLAFHPGFASNHRFFVDYTDTSGHDVVAEFRATSSTHADAGSRRQILAVSDPYPNHNGGMLAFGRDGYLYISMGDGGSQGDPGNRAQDLGVLLGKILRIDVNHGSPYSSPTSNPFVHRSGARNEIWDYGLRNPWRYSFDRSTHAMFIGDVGQNTYEEVDVEHAGSGGHNYGWRVMEGKHCYNPPSGCNRSGKVLPIVEYTHAGGNCAIVGGYVYRGSKYSRLNGAYFYADDCSGRIWAMDAGAALRGTARTKQVLDTSLMVSSFGEDASGELYVCDLSGTIYRLKAA